MTSEDVPSALALINKWSSQFRQVGLGMQLLVSMIE